MTIEEVQALIATPMNNEAVKSAYLFSCFCGLRVSDIVGLKWKNVFVNKGQYRLAVSMQDQRTDLPASFPQSVEVDAGTGRQDGRRPCVRFAQSVDDEYTHQALGESCGNRQTIYFSYGKAFKIYFPFEIQVIKWFISLKG